MNRKVKRNGLQVMGWVVGSVSLLLLLSAAGLEFSAQQRLWQENVTAALLALYLASWSYVLGLVGLVLLSIWSLVGWLRARVKQVARSRSSQLSRGADTLTSQSRKLLNSCSRA
jgi:hypothetical protein